MKKFRILLIVLTLLSFNLQFAQEVEEDENQEADATLETGSIAGQFEFLAKKSGNYRADGVRYEVVKINSLEKLRDNVLDTLNSINKKTIVLNTEIAENKSNIIELNKKLAETSSNLTSVTEEKDSMSIFGIFVSKTTYSTILWTMIAGLLLLLLFFIYKFRTSNMLTQEAKTSLSDLEIEYEDHRRRALEREQKISRKYQDELNKNKKAK
jgi:hypothetical protein